MALRFNSAAAWRSLPALLLPLVIYALAGEARSAQQAPAVETMPQLLLDTGGHMAKITDIAFTPNGKQLVSASDDKTVRVWDVETGKTVRLIRGQIGPGQEGKIYAMALSPDGRLLAVGGYLGRIAGRDNKADEDAHKIRLYDFVSGKLTGLLRGHENVVFRLAFSPDGSRLISSGADDTAIIWDVPARRPLHRLSGHTQSIRAAGFTADGRHAVTGSSDTTLRLWDADNGSLVATMQGHGNKVVSLAVSRDGIIASGDLNGEIRLWDGETGRSLRVLGNQKSWVGALSFSPDGRQLLSTCGGGPPCAANPQTVWDVRGGRKLTAYDAHDNIVLAATFSPDGRWAATAGGDDKAIHLWNPQTGERVKILTGAGLPVWATGFSSDGRSIAWGTTPNLRSPRPQISRGLLERQLRLPFKGAPLIGPEALGETGSAYQRAKDVLGPWSIASIKGGGYGIDNAVLEILEKGQLAARVVRGPSDGYYHSAYTLSPDGKTIVSGGGNGRLTTYDLGGQKLGELIGHEGDVWSVACSSDGRYLVSGAADQTVRLWNLKTRELITTLFAPKNGEWVMWTPQGFYASSAGADNMIGWQINQGAGHEAEYVATSQLRKSLNRPDIVARAIQLASAAQAIKETPGVSFDPYGLMASPVPKLQIVTSHPQNSFQAGFAKIEAAIVATPDPVKVIRIHVNGRLVAELLPEQGSGFPPGIRTFDVPVNKGSNEVAITAVNNTGETTEVVAISHEGEGALDAKGALFILAVGVDKYPNLPGNDLHYAGADAKAFAEVMEKRVGLLHTRVVKRVLVNGGAAADVPTAANIVDALALLHRAEENDTVLVFVSGHGVNEGPNYRFIPTDASWGEGGLLRQSTVVPWYAFQETIEGAKGERILFLDTCHSANAFNRRLANDSYHANIIVYSSARWDQLALEDSRLGGGHGLFTYAIIEGLNGAAKDRSGMVRAEGLRNFVLERVKTLALPLKHEQDPQYYRGRDAQDYLLARIN
jgi:WD40 repeat protein